MTVADVLTARAAVILQDRPVVPMLAWMATDGRALQVVTPVTSRLTVPLALYLGAPGSRWVVNDEGAFYDGLTGIPLRWNGALFVQDPAATAHAPGFLIRPAEPPGAQLTVSVEARTPPGAQLGTPVEQLCRVFTGREPTGWGVTEPAGRLWRRQQFSESRRGRPAGAIVVSNPGFVATVSIAPQPDGSHVESVTAVTGYPDPDTVPVAHLPAMLATVPTLTAASAHVRFGRADLTVEPRWLGAPVPLSV